jgi:ubiquinone biosynthesis protein UbiJ
MMIFGRRAPPQAVENFREPLLARLDEDPPQGFVRWNGRLLAKSLGQSAGSGMEGITASGHQSAWNRRSSEL